jgi:hypothetical protein
MTHQWFYIISNNVPYKFKIIEIGGGMLYISTLNDVWHVKLLRNYSIRHTLFLAL